MSIEIKTSIHIDASPAEVWAVLSDYSSYSSWNPFISSFEGEPKVGGKIKVKAGGMDFQPTVEVYEEAKELRWTGRLLMKGMFDGTHRFLLEEMIDGTCTFHHSELFKGMLVSLFRSKLEGQTKDGFVAMNEALKERVESAGK